MWFVLGALLVVAALAYIRLAPSNPDTWHVSLDFKDDADMRGGARRIVIGATQEEFRRLDEIARATDRTEVLAGSVEEGRITYVTRTRMIGFPDFTTVDLKDGTLRLYARLRFGRSDFGVNRRRIEGWLNGL